MSLQAMHELVQKHGFVRKEKMNKTFNAGVDVTP